VIGDFAFLGLGLVKTGMLLSYAKWQSNLGAMSRS